MAKKYAGKGIIRNALKMRSAGEIAELLQVHVSHIYNVEQRGVSPALHQAMVAAGWLRCRPGQVRLAASLTAEERDTLRALAASHGLSWSAYCRRLAEEARSTK